VATGVAAVLVLVVGPLAGCGGDRYASYCGSLEDHRAALTKTLDAGGPQALLRALPTLRDLQRDAPDDIADDWRTLTGALTGLQDALRDAGVDPATYDRAKPPPGVTQAERDRIDAAATEVGSARTQAALTAVDQQARDVCHASLTL
jgi:hypothetical protein